MTAISHAAPISKSRRWTAYALSGFAVLFLVVDSAFKLVQSAAAVEGTAQLGYPANSVLGIGIIEFVCLILYIVPRTSVLGAVLFTGYLGGAIATHVRLANPLFTHILFPVYIAALLWGGLYLREDRLRELLPVRR